MMSTRRSLFRAGVLVVALVAFGATSAWAQPNPDITAAQFSVSGQTVSVTFTAADGGTAPATMEVALQPEDRPMAGIGIVAGSYQSMSQDWAAGNYNFLFTGLEPGQTYLVGIRGVPTTGTAQAWRYRSTAAGATVDTSSVLSYSFVTTEGQAGTGTSVNPTDVTADPGVTSIALEWDAPTTAVSGYQVTWMESTNAAATFTANPPNLERVHSRETSYTITGLKAETSYRVAVRGLETGGGDTAGSWVYVDGLVTTKAQTLVAPQVRVEVICCDPADLNVSWGSVTGATGYNVEWRISGQDWGLASARATATGTSLTISDVDYGTDYDVRVQATNASGTSPWSVHAKVRVDERVRETPVATATAGNLEFTVEWTAATYATRYCVSVVPTEDRAHQGSEDCTWDGELETTTRRMVVKSYWDRYTGTRVDAQERYGVHGRCPRWEQRLLGA